MNIFLPADILIPDVESMEKWSVIACDQFSSTARILERCKGDGRGCACRIDTCITFV